MRYALVQRLTRPPLRDVLDQEGGVWLVAVHPDEEAAVARMRSVVAAGDEEAVLTAALKTHRLSRVWSGMSDNPRKVFAP